MDALAAEDALHRLGYDDLNESCCHQSIVHRALEKLGVSRKVRFGGSSYMCPQRFWGSPYMCL